jgi:hypothetical protein
MASPRERFKSFRAKYSVELRDGILVLVDANAGDRSITNDAEAVIADLAQQYDLAFTNYAVIYRDTDGIWDELVHADGRFAGFQPLRQTELDAAIAIIKSRGATL